MKKMLNALAALLFVLLFSFSVYSADSTYENTEQYISYFPYSLTSVEDEAFQGSSLNTIVFFDNLQTIREKAFAGTDKLKYIYLPASVEYIAGDAFDHSKQLTFFGEKGSYAEDWAKKNKFPFMVEFAWISSMASSQAHLSGVRTAGTRYFFLISAYVFIMALIYYTCFETRDKRQKCRAELYPIDYRFP